MIIGPLYISSTFTEHPFRLAVNCHVTMADGTFDEFAAATYDVSGVEYEAFLTIKSTNKGKFARLLGSNAPDSNFPELGSPQRTLTLFRTDEG